MFNSNSAWQPKNNETFTYIAIPLDALQRTYGEQEQPLTVTQNVVVKTLPDGSMCIIDSNHFLNSDNVINLPQEEETMVIESPSPAPTENTSKSVILKSHTKYLDDTNANKSQIRYFKCKIAQNTQSNVKIKKVRECRRGPFKCASCGDTFAKMLHYKRHMEVHAKRFKCDQCSSSYNMEENLKLHMAIHTKNEPTCPVCHRKYQRLASLKSHLFLHQVEETFTCTECLAEFEREEDLTKHAETHLKETCPENLPLTCCYCNRIFQNSDEYKEHMSFHIKMKKLVLSRKRHRKKVNVEYPHKCEVCKKTFSKYCLLERHARIHSGERPFVCPFCHRGFTQKGTLAIHVNRHNGNKPYECTLCPAKFCQKGNLRVHVEKTHIAPSTGQKIYKCSMCTCIFKRVSSLNGHITRAHSASKDCDDLSSVLAKLKELEKQVNSTKEPQNLQTKTELLALKASLSQGGSINNNTVTKDPQVQFVKLVDSVVEGTIKEYMVKQRKLGDVRWYMCSYCIKEFKKPSDLIRHLRVHTKEKPFQCTDCDQSFALKSTLATHITTHIQGIDSAAGSYQCAACLKYFRSARSLSIHMRKHGKICINQKKNFKCNLCFKLFCSSAKAKTHTQSHQCVTSTLEEIDDEQSTKIEVMLKEPMLETPNGLFPVAAPKSKVPSVDANQPTTRPYRCQICSGAFIKPIHLKRHMLTHTGEKKFRCQSCPKGFYNSYSLNEHMKYHNGVKNFCCELCDKRFVSNSLLKRHLIMHSSYRPFLCPYCKKRFKTVNLCRKHIGIHLKEIVLQATNEGEVGAAKIMDLTDTLSDNPFSITDAQNIINDKDINNDSQNIFKRPAEDSATDNSDDMQSRSPQQSFEISVDSSVLSDKAKNIMLTTTVNDPVDIETTELINPSEESLHAVDSTYPTVYINYGDLQTLGATNLYNTWLPNFKGNDQLILNSGEDQNSNILFHVDPLLNNASHDLTNSQYLDTLTPNLTLNNNFSTFSVQNSVVIDQTPIVLALPDQNPPSYQFNSNINSTVFKSDDKTENLQFINTLNNSNYILTSQNRESLPVTTNSFNSLNANQSLDLPVNSLLNSMNSLNGSTLNLFETADVMCSMCKSNFTTLQEMQNHSCLNSADSPEDDMEELPEDENPQMDTDDLNEINEDNEDNEDETDSEQSISVSSNQKWATTKHKCTYCGKRFKKRCDLVRHIRTHTGEKPYVCERCSKSFSLKSTLEYHYNTHKPGGNKEFTCSVCNSCFSSKSSLNVHTSIHTGIRKYQCPFCPERFRTSGHRKSHVAIHLKQTNLLEQFANKNSKVNSYLVSAVNEQSGIPTVASYIANDNFILQNEGNNVGMLQLNGIMNLNPDVQVQSMPLQQLDLMEGSSLAHLDQGLFTNYALNETKEKVTVNCDVCHKSYNSKDVLRKHKKIHDRRKEFQCGKCNKGFTSNDSLNKHMQLHSGHRPFSCQHCANSFTNEGNLKTHMRRIHNLSSSVIL